MRRESPGGTGAGASTPFTEAVLDSAVSQCPPRRRAQIAAPRAPRRHSHGRSRSALRRADAVVDEGNDGEADRAFASRRFSVPALAAPADSRSRVSTGRRRSCSSPAPGCFSPALRKRAAATWCVLTFDGEAKRAFAPRRSSVRAHAAPARFPCTCKRPARRRSCSSPAPGRFSRTLAGARQRGAAHSLFRARTPVAANEISTALRRRVAATARRRRSETCVRTSPAFRGRCAAPARLQRTR
jgi:hypothetical protein